MNYSLHNQASHCPPHPNLLAGLVSSAFNTLLASFFDFRFLALITKGATTVFFLKFLL